MALLGVRTRRCLITDLIFDDHMGSQTLGAPLFRSIQLRFTNIVCGCDQIAVANSFSFQSKSLPEFRTLHAIRASLLANATPSLLCCIRVEADSNHAPKLNFGQFLGRIMMTCAACTNSMRRYQLPRFGMRPKIVRPPVLCWRGTSPNQAAKSRPRS